MIERIHAFMRHAEEGVCDEVAATRHGTALLTPTLPLVWQVNAIRVEDADVAPDELTLEADHVQAAYGHRPRRPVGPRVLHPEVEVRFDPLAAFLTAGGRAAVFDDYGAGDALLRRFHVDTLVSKVWQESG